jgi:hypothetical protein
LLGESIQNDTKPIRSSRSLRRISEQLGIPKSTLADWKRRGIWGGVLVGDRRADEPAAVDAGEPVAPHEPGDPLARDPVAGLGQPGRGWNGA